MSVASDSNLSNPKRECVLLKLRVQELAFDLSPDNCQNFIIPENDLTELGPDLAVETLKQRVLFLRAKIDERNAKRARVDDIRHSEALRAQEDRSPHPLDIGNKGSASNPSQSEHQHRGHRARLRDRLTESDIEENCENFMRKFRSTGKKAFLTYAFSILKTETVDSASSLVRNYVRAEMKNSYTDENSFKSSCAKVYSFFQGKPGERLVLNDLQSLARGENCGDIHGEFHAKSAEKERKYIPSLGPRGNESIDAECAAQKRGKHSTVLEDTKKEFVAWYIETVRKENGLESFDHTSQKDSAEVESAVKNMTFRRKGVMVRAFNDERKQMNSSTEHVQSRTRNSLQSVKEKDLQRMAVESIFGEAVAGGRSRRSGVTAGVGRQELAKRRTGGTVPRKRRKLARNRRSRDSSVSGTESSGSAHDSADDGGHGADHWNSYSRSESSESSDSESRSSNSEHSEVQESEPRDSRRRRRSNSRPAGGDRGAAADSALKCASDSAAPAAADSARRRQRQARRQRRQGAAEGGQAESADETAPPARPAPAAAETAAAPGSAGTACGAGTPRVSPPAAAPAAAAAGMDRAADGGISERGRRRGAGRAAGSSRSTGEGRLGRDQRDRRPDRRRDGQRREGGDSSEARESATAAARESESSESHLETGEQHI